MERNIPMHISDYELDNQFDDELDVPDDDFDYERYLDEVEVLEEINEEKIHYE